MFDLGGSELLVIGVVALIVVGPKDLPMLFRKVGQFVGKARGMAREFSRAMDEAADEAGVKETAQSLKKIADPKKMGLDAVKDATSGLTDIDPDSHTGKLAADRAEAAALGQSPGGDIFIHGTPRPFRNTQDWTAGCIAVSDRQIEEIYAMVTTGTPIDIFA